jgi:CheY-like chemotaxis protein
VHSRGVRKEAARGERGNGGKTYKVKWCSRQGVGCGADTLVLSSFFPSPRACEAGRLRSHLAIPPVPALPSFSYKSHDACGVVFDENGEGVRRPMATILLMDDDDQVRRLVQVALEDTGYRVLSAASGEEGLHLLQDEIADLVIVDIFMPGLDGLEVIQLLRKTRPACKIIAMSGGSWEWDYLNSAKHLGANDTLKKPFSLQELQGAVSSQLK